MGNKIMRLKDKQGVWHDVPAIVGRQGNPGPSGTPGAPGPQGPDNVYIGTNPPDTAKVWINPNGEPTPTGTGIDFVDFTITPISMDEFTVEASHTPAEVRALLEDPDKQVVGRGEIVGFGKFEAMPIVLFDTLYFNIMHFEYGEFLNGAVYNYDDDDDTEWSVYIEQHSFIDENDLSRADRGKVLSVNEWGYVEPDKVYNLLPENENPNFVLDGDSEANFEQLVNSTPKRPSTSVMLSTVSEVPQSPTADGTPGDIFLSDDYLYICVGTNSWRRIAVTSW